MGLVAIVLMCGAVHASTADALLNKLTGDSESARSEARRLLPRGSIEAVPKLVKLVSHEKETVWRAAWNTLADFANVTAVPGREQERAQVAAALMTLLAADQPERIKIRALPLLVIAVPKGFDIAPLAALLDVPELREKARATFEEMATPEAREAMRAYLPKAEPAFQCALMNSLGHLRDAGSVQAIVNMASSPDAKVRAATLVAVSWTGDPRHLKMAKQVVTAADELTRSNAMDGMLRLLNAMAEKGGNWQIVVGEYLELLPKVKGVEKDAVLAGLGRIGDGTCVAPVLAAIADEQNPTRLVGINALQAMQGVDVLRQLVDAYPKLPDELKAALIPVLGGKKHALATPVLVEAAGASDPAIRASALCALGENGQAEGLAPLVAAVEKGGDAEKTIARAGLLSLADALREHQKPKEAGKAYVAALAGAKADDVELRSRALAGIAACPTAEAYDAVKAAAADKDLHEPAVKALVAVGGALGSAQKDKALTLYNLAREMQPSMADLQAIAKGMFALGEKVNLPVLLGTITNWSVVGPFELGEQNKGWDTAYIGEPNVSLSARYMSGKTRVAWTPVVSNDPNGKVNLRKTIADKDNCIGYACAEIIVKQDADALLQVGADDSERIWVNGKKVFELWQPRGLTVDQDKVPVKLKAGRNTILMKIWQNSLGWEFCARITTPDGRPLAFEQAMN